MEMERSGGNDEKKINFLYYLRKLIRQKGDEHFELFITSQIFMYILIPSKSSLNKAIDLICSTNFAALDLVGV